MELLLGVLNMPPPALLSISRGTISVRGEATVRYRDRAKSATAEMVRPARLNVRQPRRSERRPLMSPAMARQTAPGMTMSPASRGLYPNTFCR